jgi:hypothetical protein
MCYNRRYTPSKQKQNSAELNQKPQSGYREEKETTGEREVGGGGEESLRESTLFFLKTASLFQKTLKLHKGLFTVPLLTPNYYNCIDIIIYILLYIYYI